MTGINPVFIWRETRETITNSDRITDLWTQIQTRDLQNMKQSAHHFVFYFISCEAYSTDDNKLHIFSV
jgi:hypothetical protein